MTQSAPEKSTTVWQPPTSPRALRAAVAVLDRVAPSLVARGALRLWCTPTHARRHDDIPGGTSWRLPGGIVGQTWGTGPRVYLVHGWGGYRAQLRTLVQPLVDAGHQVVAYDAPSHGDSGPGELGRRRSTLTELMTAVDTVVASHGPAHAIVGHSMGAAAAALAVLDGTASDRLVLITPLADPEAYTVPFARALGFRESTRLLFVRRMEALVDRRLADLVLPDRAAGRLDLPPVLVLADRADKEADPADGARIADAWPMAELLTSDGLGHRRILRDDATIAAIVDYVSA